MALMGQRFHYPQLTYFYSFDQLYAMSVVYFIFEELIGKNQSQPVDKKSHTHQSLRNRIYVNPSFEMKILCVAKLAPYVTSLLNENDLRIECYLTQEGSNPSASGCNREDAFVREIPTQYQLKVFRRVFPPQYLFIGGTFSIFRRRHWKMKVMIITFLLFSFYCPETSQQQRTSEHLLQSRSMILVFQGTQK